MSTPTLMKRKKPPGYQQLRTFMKSHKNDLSQVKHFDEFFRSYRMDVAFWSLSLKNIYSYKQLFNAWKCLYFELWMEEFHDHSHELSRTEINMNSIRMNKSLWRMIHYDYLSLCNSNEKYERERNLRDQQNLKTYPSSSSKDISSQILEWSTQSEQQQQQQQIQQTYKKDKKIVSQEKMKFQKNQQEVKEKIHQIHQEQQQQQQQQPQEPSYIHMKQWVTRFFPPIMGNDFNLLKQFIINISVTTMIILIIMISIFIFWTLLKNDDKDM